MGAVIKNEHSLCLFMMRGNRAPPHPVLAWILFLLFPIILSVRQGATFVYLDMLLSKESLNMAEQLWRHQSWCAFISLAVSGLLCSVLQEPQSSSFSFPPVCQTAFIWDVNLLDCGPQRDPDRCQETDKWMSVSWHRHEWENGPHCVRTTLFIFDLSDMSVFTSGSSGI